MADDFPDYYELLGLTSEATVEQIQRAYRHEIRYWHPDNWVGRAAEAQLRAQKTTVQLNEAYAVLSDPQKREVYDQLCAELKTEEQVANITGNNRTEFRLLQFFEHVRLTVIDKRPQGGTLWIVGGQELSNLFATLKKKGFPFVFAKNGSRSTRNRPAWYLDLRIGRHVAGVTDPEPKR